MLITNFQRETIFVDWEIYDLEKQKKIFNEMRKLIDFYHNKLK